MLVAREKVPDDCGSDEGVSLWNTLESLPGGIFSKIDASNEAGISPERDVEWTEQIDGFQSSPPSHSYLQENVKSRTGPAVVVLRMKNSRSKTEMTRTLQDAVLQCCDDKECRKLLSSSVVLSSGSSLLWKGEDALRPRAVVLKHSSMSSGAAEKKGSWIELYIGAASGQLMKIVLDKQGFEFWLCDSAVQL
ncbi:hypothetical protein AOLI_G00323830 [Acnodon oligacanthus]